MKAKFKYKLEDARSPSRAMAYKQIQPELTKALKDFVKSGKMCQKFIFEGDFKSTSLYRNLRKIAIKEKLPVRVTLSIAGLFLVRK